MPCNYQRFSGHILDVVHFVPFHIIWSYSLEFYFHLFIFFQCGRSFNPRFLFTWPTAQVAMDTVEDMVSMCCAEVSLFWFLWFFFFGSIISFNG